MLGQTSPAAQARDIDPLLLQGREPARDLVKASSGLLYPPPLAGLVTIDNIQEWHRQVSHHIEQVFEVTRESLYTLFRNPTFDSKAAWCCVMSAA
jgi:hypothetical protein